WEAVQRPLPSTDADGEGGGGEPQRQRCSPLEEEQKCRPLASRGDVRLGRCNSKPAASDSFRSFICDEQVNHLGSVNAHTILQKWKWMAGSTGEGEITRSRQDTASVQEEPDALSEIPSGRARSRNRHRCRAQDR